MDNETLPSPESVEDVVTRARSAVQDALGAMSLRDLVVDEPKSVPNLAPLDGREVS